MTPPSSNVVVLVVVEDDGDDECAAERYVHVFRLPGMSPMLYVVPYVRASGLKASAAETNFGYTISFELSSQNWSTGSSKVMFKQVPTNIFPR